MPVVKSNKLLDSNELLKELILKQFKTLSQEKKLQYSDLKRLCKYINMSIFDETNCCVWQGYITNANNTNKGMYINFYFRKKKVALHRLLYINYVDDLKDDEYLKFSCQNKGKCCNINHLKKFKYQIENTKDSKDLKKPKVQAPNIDIANTVKIINKTDIDEESLSKLRVKFF